MDNETAKPTQREKVAKTGGFSTAFGIIGFLFLAVPIFSVAAVVLAIFSIRTSRRIGAPATWPSLIGLFLGAAQLCFASRLYWLLLTGQLRFH